MDAGGSFKLGGYEGFRWFSWLPAYKVPSRP